MESNTCGEVITGTTIVAVKFTGGADGIGGVVMGADTRVSTGIYVANRASYKIAQLHDRIYCCRSGSAADTQFVSALAKRYIAEHSIALNSLPTVRSAASILRLIAYNNKDRLCAGMIVGGWDPKKGATVYSIPVGGSLFEQEYAVGGSGSTYIWGLIDDSYKPDMTKDETEKFVKKVVSHAMARDGSSGGCIRMTTITEKDVVEKFVSGDALPYGP
eukprot:GHVL01035225.1.p1 GENE.GHVL01035225.1~~GHVL01035225.1.p1  ORF type:complete len:217 (+),score=42.33 GHVL01035225.1:29-679(+)